MNLQFPALIWLDVEGIRDLVPATVFADVTIDKELPGGYDCDLSFVSVIDPDTGSMVNVSHKLDCEDQAILCEKARDEYDILLNAAREQRSESNSEIRDQS